MLVVRFLPLLSANKINTEFVVNGDRLERNSFYSEMKVGKFSIDGNIHIQNRLKHLRFT
jgi:hypothetical protein